MVLLIVVVIAVWILQRVLAMRQAMRFRRQYSSLRREGRDVAVGSARRVGRRVYVALAADSDGVVREAMVFRGATIFAQGQGDTRLEGLRVSQLRNANSGRLPDGLPPMTAEAVTQAAGFLSAAADKRRTKAATSS